MAIIKNIENKFGITTSYHNIGYIGLFLAGDNAQVRVDNYIDKTARANMKEPVSNLTYNIPYSVIITALASGNLFVGVYEYLHSLSDYENGEKDLDTMHVAIRTAKEEEARIKAETEKAMLTELLQNSQLNQEQGQEQTQTIITVAGGNVALLKANTKYKVTSNASSLSASGTTIDLAYSLRYSNQKQTTVTSVTQKDVHTVSWTAEKSLSASTVIFTTNTGDNDIHRVHIVAKKETGLLNGQLEFYLEEQA